MQLATSAENAQDDGRCYYIGNRFDFKQHLLMAEGGSGGHHAVSIHSSKNLTGP